MEKKHYYYKYRLKDEDRVLKSIFNVVDTSSVVGISRHPDFTGSIILDISKDHAEIIESDIPEISRCLNNEQQSLQAKIAILDEWLSGE